MCLCVDGESAKDFTLEVVSFDSSFINLGCSHNYEGSIKASISLSMSSTAFSEISLFVEMRVKLTEMLPFILQNHFEMFTILPVMISALSMKLKEFLASFPRMLSFQMSVSKSE